MLKYGLNLLVIYNFNGLIGSYRDEYFCHKKQLKFLFPIKILGFPVTIKEMFNMPIYIMEFPFCCNQFHNSPGVGGAALQTHLDSLIDSLPDPFPPNLPNAFTPKP